MNVLIIASIFLFVTFCYVAIDTYIDKIINAFKSLRHERKNEHGTGEDCAEEIR